MAIRSLMSICSGIGGLDLGVHLANPKARTVCYIEREAYAAAILMERMEDQILDKAPIWDDLTTFNGEPWRGKVDCIIAGFPCQPWSFAGKRKGTKDERWLWDDIFRVLCEIRPLYIFLENVPGLLRGGIEYILKSLAEEGYDAEWDCFSAKQCGFSHKRERLFILAKLANTRLERTNISSEFPDSNSERLQGRSIETSNIEEKRDIKNGSTMHNGYVYFIPGYNDREGWQNIIEKEPMLEPAICRATDGSPNWMVNANAYREDRIRALGNGVIPLVAAIAFKILVERINL